MQTSKMTPLRNLLTAAAVIVLGTPLVTGCISVDAATAENEDDFLQKVSDRSQKDSKRENAARLAELELLNTAIHCYSGPADRLQALSARLAGKRADGLQIRRVEIEGPSGVHGTGAGGGGC